MTRLLSPSAKRLVAEPETEPIFLESRRVTLAPTCLAGSKSIQIVPLRVKVNANLRGVQ